MRIELWNDVKSRARLHGIAARGRTDGVSKCRLMQSNSWSKTQQRWVTSGFPFTIFMMASLFATAVATTIPAARPFLENFFFVGPGDLAQPWKMLLYPLRGTPSLFSLLFDVGMTYLFCSSLERSWGTKAFALFYVAISVISALSISAGAALLGTEFVAANLFVVAGAAVVWGFINSEEQMSLFFLPMRGIHFAGLAVLYIFFNYAMAGGWGAVPFALVGCAAAFGWLKYGITYRIQSWDSGLIPMSRPVAHAPRARPKLRLVSDDKPLDDKWTMRDLNPLEWLAKRKRRKQFEKLVGGDD